MQALFSQPFELLLGRRTYDIFAKKARQQAGLINCVAIRRYALARVPAASLQST